MKVCRWSLFDFVDPPRNAALRAADREIGEQEPDVLKIHLEQFLLPAVPVDPAAYISQPPPSGGSNVTAAEAKKPIWVKVTGRKYMAAGAATSAVTGGVSVPVGSVVVIDAAELASPTRVSKKCRIVPALTTFEAIQAAYAMPTGSTAGVQVEDVSSAPLTSVEIVPSAVSEPSLSDLISQSSVAAAVSYPILLPMPTTAVVVTTSPVSTPLPSSVTPTSLFDSPFSVFSAAGKEMPTVFAAHEATSTGDTAVSDAGGSSHY
ncbi:hypothetical protein Hanom_Chr07g00659191 [Helianthus anomalus]